MRNKLSAFLILFSVITVSLKSQTKVIKLSPEEYSRLKAEGSIDFNKYSYDIDFKSEDVQATKIKPSKANSILSGNIACSIIDQSTVPAVSFGGAIAVDDQSTLIDIPFNFCFYGTNYGDFYLNSNGNITFGSQFISFTASGFPTNGPRMIAPFWADFDNRPSSNGVARISVTATAAIITWDSMGYYNSHADKRNTCQLVITNGTDPILPSGYNVGFLYEDMDWTTGDASSGTNGFGGTAATVGINQGDGVNFVQVGRFDSPGGTFVSNTATNSGIDWLDYKVFFFNICTSGSSTNIAPIASNLSFCDTIKICNLTDTLILHSQFLAPEPSQTNTITVTCATLPAANLVVTYGTPGSTSDVTVEIRANPSLAGIHYVDYMSIDNGSPHDTTIVTQVVHIYSDPSFAPTIVMPPAPVCSVNSPYTVSIGPNCTDYTSIIWMDAVTTCTHTFSNIMPTLNKMNVTVKGLNGCQRTLFDSLKIYTTPVPTITGPTFYCGGAGTNLNATVASMPVGNIVTDYAWDVPGSTNSAAVHVSSGGPVTVTVTTNQGCAGTATTTVTNAAPTVTISQSPTTFCPGSNVTLTASIAGATSYSWTGGATGTTQAINVVGPGSTTSYNVDVLISGCHAINTIALAPLPAVTLQFTDSVFCANEVDTIRAITNPTNATLVWNPGGFTTQSINAAPGITYTVVATAPAGGLCPSASKTVMETINPLPNIGSIVDDELDPYDDILCYKDKKHLLADNISSGTPPFTYSWSPSGTNDTLTISQPGKCILTVTDSKGCKDKDSITIVLKQPTVTLVGNPLICLGEDTARIIAIGSASGNPFTLSWTPASIGSTDLHGIDDTVYVYSASTYTATITDQVYGCQVSQTYIVNNFPEPVANFIDEPDSVSEWQIPVLFQNASTISSGTTSVVSWQYGDGSGSTGGSLQIHDYAAPGNYPVTLIVKSNKGCYDTITVNHLVEVHLPLLNIITPNGDNINQKLSFKGLEFFSEKKIIIYNRWGKKVYEKDNYDNNFDGADLEAGTYYYILEVKGHRPESVLSNFFQIIR